MSGARRRISWRFSAAGCAGSTQPRPSSRSSRPPRTQPSWDVIQDEATREQSKSARPMFGDSFPV